MNTRSTKRQRDDDPETVTEDSRQQMDDVDMENSTGTFKPATRDLRGLQSQDKYNVNSAFVQEQRALQQQLSTASQGSPSTLQSDPGGSQSGPTSLPSSPSSNRTLRSSTATKGGALNSPRISSPQSSPARPVAGTNLNLVVNSAIPDTSARADPIVTDDPVPMQASVQGAVTPLTMNTVPTASTPIRSAAAAAAAVPSPTLPAPTSTLPPTPSPKTKDDPLLAILNSSNKLTAIERTQKLDEFLEWAQGLRRKQLLNETAPETSKDNLAMILTIFQQVLRVTGFQDTLREVLTQMVTRLSAVRTVVIDAMKSEGSGAAELRKELGLTLNAEQSLDFLIFVGLSHVQYETAYKMLPKALMSLDTVKKAKKRSISSPSLSLSLSLSLLLSFFISFLSFSLSSF
jgi:hypothetical protein